jgi:hypothetical protein
VDPRIDPDEPAGAPLGIILHVDGVRHFHAAILRAPLVRHVGSLTPCLRQSSAALSPASRQTQLVALAARI